MVRLIKRHSPKHSNIVPGWSDNVKPFFDEARLWHSILISAGEPFNTELHRIMKQIRNEYHYALRKSKWNIDNILKEKFFFKR